MKQVILLPGALGHAAQFDSLIKALQDKSIQARALELPNHGKSELSQGVNSVPGMAQSLLNQLDDLKINEPVSVFGHSLGGYIGLYLCLKFPSRINKLFTLGTKWHWTQDIVVKETSLLNPDIMEQKIPKYVEYLKSIHTQDWALVVNSISELMTDLGINQYLAPQNLTKIGHEIRISQGDRDSMVTFEESIATYKALLNANFQVYPCTPHPYEKVSVLKLAADIAEFLQDK